MRRVLVTGGAGFVGARVVQRLIEQDHDVAIVLRSTSDTRRLHGLLDHCTVLQGNLTNLEGLRTSIHAFAPQGVVHLAWEGVHGAERNNLIQMSNVSSSIDLFQLTGEIGCSNFVGLGSQAEYGLLSGRVDESAPTKPTTIYGAAKLATGCLLERAAVANNRPFAWLRLFSTYGPDDDPSWLIPYTIRKLLAGERPLLTKAEQTWDYIHVDDVADAIVSALHTSAFGIFNLGSGQARPLREIIEYLRDAIDPDLLLGFGEVEYRPDQVMHLESDIGALHTATGWTPRVSLEQGLSSTIAWHRATLDKYPIH